MAKTSYDIPTVRKTISIINLLCESQGASRTYRNQQKIGNEQEYGIPDIVYSSR